MTKFVAILITLIAAIAFGESANAEDAPAYPYMTFYWTSASGPVAEYAVFADRNGEGYPGYPEKIVKWSTVDIYVEYGQTIQIRVAARDIWGNQGSYSLDSEVYKAIAALPPGIEPEPEPPVVIPDLNPVLYNVEMGNARELCEARGFPTYKLSHWVETGRVLARCLKN